MRVDRRIAALALGCAVALALPTTVDAAPPRASDLRSAAVAPALLPGDCPIPRSRRDGCYSRIAEAALPAIWQAELASRGRTFAPARIVEVARPISTACMDDTTGIESSFYCDEDETIYLPVGIRAEYVRYYQRDLARQSPAAFAEQARRLGVTPRRLRRDGSYGPVFEFAHEYGHHVQHLLGWQDWNDARMAEAGTFRREARLQAAFELSADCLGAWWTEAADRSGAFPLTPLDRWSRRAMVVELGTAGFWRVGLDFSPYVPTGDPVIRRSQGHGTVRQRLHMEEFGAALAAGDDVAVRCAAEAARISTSGQVPPL